MMLKERSSSPLIIRPYHLVLRYKKLQPKLSSKSSYTMEILAKISMSYTLFTSCVGH